MLLVGACASLAFAKPVAPGNGTTIFGDVPVAPGSFPDYSPAEFGLKGSRSIKPQTLNIGNYADYNAMIAWYRKHLAQRGWHVEQVKNNYPGPGRSAIIASRSGEAITVVVSSVRGGVKVALIKLNSSK